MRGRAGITATARAYTVIPWIAVTNPVPFLTEKITW
jgi:hypothetical protein